MQNVPSRATGEAMSRRAFTRTGTALAAIAIPSSGIASMQANGSAPVADPVLALIQKWDAATAKANSMEWPAFKAFYDENVTPIELAVNEGLPPATTREGAAAALRKALSFDDLENQDASLVRAALGYLEGSRR